MKTQVQKIKNISGTVRNILTQFPETRDNHELLCLKVWATQYPPLREAEIPFRKFALEFLYKRFASSESIRRSRQKIQELSPKLRGKTSEVRQEFANEMTATMPGIQV